MGRCRLRKGTARARPATPGANRGPSEPLARPRPSPFSGRRGETGSPPYHGGAGAEATSHHSETVALRPDY
jgi:hypothetical protein